MGYAGYRPLLTEKDWEIAGKLALFLALAESLDYSESSTVATIIPSADHMAATLEIRTAENASIEMLQIKYHEAWFTETFGVPLTVIVKE